MENLHEKPPPTEGRYSALAVASGSASVAKKQPLPPEVLEIMRDVARYQYQKLVAAGWCVTCYRQPAGHTTRCEECRVRHDLLQEKRTRANGGKPWKAGGRGRKPYALAHIKSAAANQIS